MTKRSQRVDSKMIRLVAPAAAAATGLWSVAAPAAPGDLDPGFGDVGRVIYGPLGGAVQAVAADDDGVLFGAGVDYVSWYDNYEFDGLIDRLGTTGARDGTFQVFANGLTDIHDVARQPDGKVVAAGSWMDAAGAPSTFVVVRLNENGTPDATFAADGSWFPEGFSYLNRSSAASERAASLVIDPDGRITVAGVRGDRLLVARLKSTGGIDASFATGGIFEGPALVGLPRIVRTSSGAYRLAFDGSSGCQVLALTTAGVIDTSFGVGGTTANVTESPGSVRCAGIANGDPGQLYVAGTLFGDDGSARGFATRLSASGAIDATFDADAATGGMRSVSALTAGGGSVFLAGKDASGAPGAVIVRLGGSGALDAAFGEQGRTWFETPLPGGAEDYREETVLDLETLPDRTLYAGGGTVTRPVVARYFGDAGGDSPGIVGFETRFPGYVDAAEDTGVARVLVRRVGGSAGAVSVAYSTGSAALVGPPATAVTDYSTVMGRLDWADGDTAAKEILVPLKVDSGESGEWFTVRLSDPHGGAGLATDTSYVQIRSDGIPAGLIRWSGSPSVTEGSRYAIRLSRSDAASGVVSVVVTVAAGTAVAGVDYQAFTPVTVTWADGEYDEKLITIDTIDDADVEGSETVIVSIGAPTGGAVVAEDSGPRTIIISDNDIGQNAGRGNGGGGSAGWLLTGLFALLGAFGRRNVR